MPKYKWTGGNAVEMEGVRGIWIPNEPVDVSGFTSAEIAVLDACPGMKKVLDEPKETKELKEPKAKKPLGKGK